MRSPVPLIGLVLTLLFAVTPAEAEVELSPAVAGSPSLKSLRKSMLAGAKLSNVQLQTLADAGEGLAAARYAKRLEERGVPEFLDDAAHYYSIAVYMKRDFALPRLIALLGRKDVEIGSARLRNLQGVLELAARRGNQAAAAALAEFLIQGAPFEADIPLAREMLLLAAETGDAEAAIRLALSHIQGAPGLPPDPAEAGPALELAMTSPDPGVLAMAKSLALQIPGGETLKAAALPAADPADLDRSRRPRTRPTFEGVAP